MDPPPTLPQELLNEVVDDLRSEPEALKHCALASRCLLERSQQNLFFAIHISSATHSLRILNVLTSKRILSHYIRDLCITIDEEWCLRDSSLPSILSMLTFLESLTIKGQTCALWNKDIPRETADALMRLVAFPSIRSLAICNFYDAPLDFFSIPKHLKSLELNTVTVVNFPRSDVIAIPHMSTDCLELLLFSSFPPMDEEILAVLMRPNAIFSQVKVLRAYYVGSTRYLFKTMQASKLALEIIELHHISSHVADGEQEGLSTIDFSSMPNLKCLAFCCAINPTSGFPWPECTAVLASIRDLISVNPTVLGVKKIQIIFTAYRPLVGCNNEKWIELPAFMGESWETLDQALNHGRGSTNLPFHLDMVLRIKGLSGEDRDIAAPIWKSLVSSRMPITSASEGLHCRLDHL
ncbi:hypothetical protein Hypma_014426 [Hypsizygus marmoreus]|uniref:F-box domain-containing protein n=1 Tax=Hypsizygus marmoreus TaxID=39966 RepID=A0A369JEJ8_HYPMA|nr:hypothetical protein Hypma_014426 [Hypsizygus marmoreus]